MYKWLTRVLAVAIIGLLVAHIVLKQAGIPEFRVANLLRDRDVLELARAQARSVLEGPNEHITQQERANAIVHLKSHWNRRYGLVEVG